MIDTAILALGWTASVVVLLVAGTALVLVGMGLVGAIRLSVCDQCATRAQTVTSAWDRSACVAAALGSAG